MVFPKNIIYKKIHKKKLTSLKKSYSYFLSFSYFAIKSLEPVRICSKLLSVVLFKIRNLGKKVKKVWLLIFSSKSSTKKKEKTRMGKGSGIFYKWFCNIHAGQLILEFEPTTDKVSYLVYKKMQSLLPNKIYLIKK